ncbi:MAG: MFS transporter [Promethearchaeota archaeon]
MEKTTKSTSILSLILFITIVALINSAQYMISPNLLTISKYFGFGKNITPLGILAFSFIILSGVAMLIFGYLADKIIRKWILLIGVMIYSISAIFTIGVPPGINGYYMFFMITIFIGIGFGAIIPSTFSLIGDIVSKEDRSKGLSFFSIASLFGMLVGTGLAIYAGYADWRLPYFIIGIAGITVTIIILFFKEPSRIGKDYFDILEKDAIDYTYRIKFSDLKIIFKKKSNVWLIINFVDTIPTGIILFLLFAYMEDYHNLKGTIPLIVLLFTLLSTLIGTVIFGFVGDNYFKKGNKKARVNLALLGNIIPIPFVYIALIIPFTAPNNATIAEIFLIPGFLIMLIFLIIGLFANGAVNGNWYATVVDLNLPEHRGTVLSSANFFDIFGRALGPLIGAIIADNYGFVWGMAISILFWIFIPVFWISVLKNCVSEMEATEAIFTERIKSLKNN